MIAYVTSSSRRGDRNLRRWHTRRVDSSPWTPASSCGPTSHNRHCLLGGLAGGHAKRRARSKRLYPAWTRKCAQRRAERCRRQEAHLHAPNRMARRDGRSLCRRSIANSACHTLTAISDDAWCTCGTTYRPCSGKSPKVRILRARHDGKKMTFDPGVVHHPRRACYRESGVNLCNRNSRAGPAARSKHVQRWKAMTATLTVWQRRTTPAPATRRTTLTLIIHCNLCDINMQPGRQAEDNRLPAHVRIAEKSRSERTNRTSERHHHVSLRPRKQERLRPATRARPMRTDNTAPLTAETYAHTLRARTADARKQSPTCGRRSCAPRARARPCSRCATKAHGPEVRRVSGLRQVFNNPPPCLYFKHSRT